MLMRKTCSLAAVLVLVGMGTAWPSDTKRDRETLKGLKAIAVVVEDLKPEAERDGITQSQLQTDVELRLRQLGVLVDTESLEYLYVHVRAIKTTGVSGYAYSALAEVRQPVMVARTGQGVFAATWSQELLATTPLTRASQSVREDVRDLVDSFINAYLSVNPKP
jgi:hypothetical protein